MSEKKIKHLQSIAPLDSAERAILTRLLHAPQRRVDLEPSAGTNYAPNQIKKLREAIDIPKTMVKLGGAKVAEYYLSQETKAIVRAALKP